MITPSQRMRLLGCLVLGASLACSSPPTVTEAERATPEHRALTDEFVVFENESLLADHLVLEQVTRDPTAVPTVVQFELRNLADTSYDFMYRCLWLDENGIEILHSTDVWTRRTIAAAARMNLRCAAPSPRAVDYRLVLRPWQRDP